MIFRKFLITVILIASVSNLLIGQELPSGKEYRRTAIHNGNLVRTVFGNWGVVGQPAESNPRGSWLHDNNGYIGDVSPLFGVEITAPNVGVPTSFPMSRFLYACEKISAFE